MYSLTVLEAQSLKSRCRHGWFLLEVLRENLFSASLLASCGCQQFLVFLASQMHHSNLCLCLHMVFSSLSSPLLIRTPVIGFKASSNLGWLHLNLITSTKSLFPSKLTFWVSGQTWILGRHHTTHDRRFKWFPKIIQLTGCEAATQTKVYRAHIQITSFFH